VGLILPVGLALAWEVLAALGVGLDPRCRRRRRSCRTLGDLAMRGVSADHVLTTLGRVAAGFLLGVAAGTRWAPTGSGRWPAGCWTRPSGAAQHPVDRLGAAVHLVVRHLQTPKVR